MINGVMTHAAIDSLPFGSVGASGRGAYHGIPVFRHRKPGVVQNEDGASNLRLRTLSGKNRRHYRIFTTLNPTHLSNKIIRREQ
jgi:coniferyl-aldehyde dehydrogenase